jgi:hypothetical protein
MERKIDNMKNETIYLEEAIRFVKGNIVNASNGRVCVDGRYDPNGQQIGFLARAGADFGISMGLLALSKQGKINVTPQEAVDSVYNHVTQNDGKFYMHTDQHSVDDKKLIGCGHAGRAANPEYSDMFGVDANTVTNAILYARDKNQHPNSEEVILNGEHAEKGVLIVKGLLKTLNHQNKEGAQYFIYDKDRDDKFVEDFVKQAHILGLTADDLKQSLETQTNATVQLLAENKPVIEVDLREETPKTTFISIVPPLNSQN